MVEKLTLTNNPVQASYPTANSRWCKGDKCIFVLNFKYLIISLGGTLINENKNIYILNKLAKILSVDKQRPRPQISWKGQIEKNKPVQFK